MELSDEAAVERCLKGDRDAFSLLVEKYQNAVYGLCYHIVGNFTDAQDLTQEAFVRAYLEEYFVTKVVDGLDFYSIPAH